MNDATAMFSRSTTHDTPILIPVENVTFVKEFYIRFKPNDATIEQYRASIGMFPPIVLARGHILVDGFHRWQAHRREGVAEISARDLGNLSDLEIKKEAWLLNNAHGFAPSTAERKSACDSFYRDGVKDYAEIAKLVGVTENTAREYCRDARKDEVEKQKEKAWDLWLDCNTQEQIASAVGVDQKTVSNWLGNFQSVGDFLKPPGATAENPWGSVQHFDIWQFQNADKDAGSQSYFGALPPQVVENLLWFWTEPGQIVFDPFAGSGTTIEVAKSMGRRVWASDIRGNHYAPHLPIHQHDILSDWPTNAPKKADLILLDPPYWKQAVGRYSKEPDEMAEMDLTLFYNAWARVVRLCASHTKRIAYIISPTQNEDGSVTDHATDMLTPFRELKWSVERRIIVPYQTQQATGQQVTWARENRRMLKLYRDLVVLTS